MADVPHFSRATGDSLMTPGAPLWRPYRKRPLLLHDPKGGGTGSAERGPGVAGAVFRTTLVVQESSFRRLNSSTISPSRRGRRGGEVQAETVRPRPGAARPHPEADGVRRECPEFAAPPRTTALSAPRFGEARALLGTARPRRCLTAAAVRGWAGTLRCRGTPATAGAAGGAGRTRSHDPARPWVRQCARRLLQWGRVSPYGRLEVLGGHPGLDQHDPAAVVHGVHHAAEPPAAALRPLGQQARPPTLVARQAAHPAVPGTRGPLATDPGQRRPLGQRQAVPPGRHPAGHRSSMPAIEHPFAQQPIQRLCLGGHRQLLPLHRRRLTGGGPGGAGPGRAPGCIGEGRPAADSCERSRAARRRGTGRSPRCSSTLGYASPSWPPSRWAICRSRPAGVGCGFARGRATPTREVPLNSVCRHAIDEWTTARTDQVAAGAATSSPPAASAALWLSRSESRISARVIDLIIRRLAKDAHLELSAHTLLEGPSMTAVGTSHRARRGRPAAAEVRPAGLRHLLAVVVAGARCGRGGRLGPGGRPPRLARRPRLAWWCGRRGARCAAGCGRCCVGRGPPAPGRCSSRGHAREVRELVPPTNSSTRPWPPPSPPRRPSTPAPPQPAARVSSGRLHRPRNTVRRAPPVRQVWNVPPRPSWGISIGCGSSGVRPARCVTWGFVPDLIV